MNELEKYLVAHSSPRDGALEWIETQTHLRTKFAHMLAGFEAGKLLETFSRMARPTLVVFEGEGTISAPKVSMMDFLKGFCS